MKTSRSTLFPTPILLVTPRLMDFGQVVTNTVATNTFLIENVGRGRVAGKVTVASPFRILDGGTYSLSHGSKQVVTVTYNPRILSGSNDLQTATFTGAGVAKATLTGTPAVARGR